MTRISTALLLVLPATLQAQGPAAEPWLPKRIGRTTVERSRPSLIVGNGAISVAWSRENPLAIRAIDRLEPNKHVDLEPLLLTLADGSTLSSSDMTRTAAASVSTISVNRKSSRTADRFGGVIVDQKLSDSKTHLAVDLQIELRDESNYARETVTLTAGDRDVDVRRIQLIGAAVPGAHTVGTTQGSPAASELWFLGVEHPMAATTVEGGEVKSWIERKLPLLAGKSVTYSAVVGVAPAGQLRRSFLRYIERERAHPYRPFLHYNSWYDLGYFNRYNEKECVERIDTFGKELAQKRGVKLSSFLFDDGWDDVDTNWKFHSGFPHQFAPLTEAAKQFGAAPGIWLSPWGGYGDPRTHRLAAAKKSGYEVDSEGLALSGPVYYKLFHEVCMDLLRQGINQFKFDGTGSPDKQVPGSAFDSDFDAAIALIKDLRTEKPDLFVNLTTGTWPSPFWTRYADSIWRGGEDHSFAGVGSKRQQWMTYRDGDTYRGIVQQGPLFPLNSLMLHGIIYAQYANNLKTDPQDDFKSDVRTYFGTGTQLQEMYVTPGLLTQKNWDDLAEAAKWAQRNAGVLKDVHWIGGDPLKLEVYGHAAWSGSRAVVVLRNPSDKPQTFDLDLASALELPNLAYAFEASSPWAEDSGKPAMSLRSDHTTQLSLKPFEVLTLDLKLSGH